MKELIALWSPAALATALCIAAALAGFSIGRRKAPALPTSEPVAAPVAAYALSFAAAPPGGLMATAEAMIRIDEELRLAAQYGRPLCIALLGLDPAPEAELDEAMEAVRQLTAGALRRPDIVADRGPSEILVLLVEASQTAGWVATERIQRRVSAASVGTLRAILLSPAPTATLREVLDELDGGLEVCRQMGIVFADPARLLAPSGQ